MPIILAGIGIILTLPSLGIGLLFDDYVQRELILGKYHKSPEIPSIYGMFTMLDGNPVRTKAIMDAGDIPWWTYLGLRSTFLRPITELTHGLDYQLWPNAPWLMHLQSLLWFGAIIWIITLLYRRIIKVKWIAGLAAFLFAIDRAHGMPVAWIANRNVLLCMFFGGLTLLAHDKWRKDGWQPGAILGPLSLALGLLAGEASLAVAAYLIAYLLFIDQDKIKSRIIGILPYAVIIIIWGISYHLLGYGTYGMGAYLDPSRETSAFIRAIIERAPILLLGQFAEPPPDLYGADVYKLFPHGELIIWLVAVLVLVIISLILLPLFKKDNVVRFWTVGMLLSIIPVCATFPSNRLLFFVSIGAFGIIAQFFAAWLDTPKSNLPRKSITTKSMGIVAIFFIIIHLILSPIVLPINTVSFALYHKVYISDPALSMPFDEKIKNKTVVILNPPSAFWGMMATKVRDYYQQPNPARIYALASGILPLTLTRIDNQTFDIENNLGLMQLTFDQVLRGPSQPMHVGEQIVLPGMTVEVRAIADGWQPATARFKFPVPLDNPEVLLLVWKNGKYVPYTPPAIGESELLPKIR
ncbi:MAG: hypothetical protein ACE14V_07440 [bacterium]